MPMGSTNGLTSWLMESDPAVRWQTMRDLQGAPAKRWQAERRRTLKEGWGAQLSALHSPDGSWGRGIYLPKWTSTIWDSVREIRVEGRTVFLTTRLMEEAEKLCDRVMIVDHGREAALDTPSALVRSLRAESRVLVNCEGAFAPQVPKSISAVSRVEQDGQRVIVYGRAPQPGQPPLIAAVANALSAQRIAFTDIRMEQASLEDVFLQLTGRAIRD